MRRMILVFLVAGCSSGPVTEGADGGEEERRLQILGSAGGGSTSSIVELGKAADGGEPEVDAGIEQEGGPDAATEVVDGEAPPMVEDAGADAEIAVATCYWREATQFVPAAWSPNNCPACNLAECCLSETCGCISGLPFSDPPPVCIAP